GCLVNTFAPASLGDAVRVGLVARKIDGPDRLWTAGGAAASVAALRGLTMAVLVVAASVTGALPLWPVAVIVGGTVVAGAVAWIVWRRRPDGRIGSFAGAFTALLRCPRAAVA